MSTLEVREANGGPTWVALELQHIDGLGRLRPRLRVYFTAPTAREYKQVLLEDVTLRLEYRQELIGEGRVIGVQFCQKKGK